MSPVARRLSPAGRVAPIVNDELRRLAATDVGRERRGTVNPES
ncbi:MAG: hypothetical protein JWL71_598 [Acidobacteria bacterium]|nr:hypothetical protein [Acidobacteriota bacterium]